MDGKEENTISRLKDLEEGKFYRISVLQAILKNLGLNYSIFTIRDYETWKCLDYKCGHRHNQEASVCEKCGGAIRPPLILSPRTRGGGKGPGHRRYTAEEIRGLVDVFKERK